MLVQIITETWHGKSGMEYDTYSETLDRGQKRKQKKKKNVKIIEVLVDAKGV